MRPQNQAICWYICNFACSVFRKFRKGVQHPPLKFETLCGDRIQFANWVWPKNYGSCSRKCMVAYHPIKSYIYIYITSNLIPHWYYTCNMAPWWLDPGVLARSLRWEGWASNTRGECGTASRLRGGLSLDWREHLNRKPMVFTMKYGGFL